MDDQRLRLNGTLSDSTEWTTPSILAVGNSAAFGDEVDDADTWPAQLEQRLQRRVLNAGMSAYGIDQAVLRAERLVPRFDSSIVVLSVVSDDVLRTAMSFHYYWKPYFSVDGDSLSLRRPPGPGEPWPDFPLMKALGYSHTARFLMKRTFPEAWDAAIRYYAHRDYREVSGRLLRRLDSFTRERGVRLLVVLLAGGNANVEHIEDLRSRAEADGIHVLDLSGELAVLARDPDENVRMFEPHHHLSPEGNELVSEHIAARLEELEWIVSAKDIELE